MSKATNTIDRQQIRDIIESWVVWRDAGMWEKFRTLWHDDGVMNATWFQGPVDEFIARGRMGGSGGGHLLGGMAIEIKANRAVAQTKMQITARGPVEGVLCDVACSGRFHDFLEKRRGRWGLVLRQPIYEKDQMIPVTPGTAPKLDPELLAQFPEGYKRLGYVQTRAGMTVKRDMPGLSGPELDALYARGEAWLKGKPLTASQIGRGERKQRKK
ncbi:MAG: nuclear transport factor 2 family protein [Xanthobacteraceae bacterium]